MYAEPQDASTDGQPASTGPSVLDEDIDIDVVRAAARDRQRLNASRLAVLHDVGDVASRLASEEGIRVDGIALATAFLDFMSESMLGRDGVPHGECLSFLRDAASQHAGREASDASLDRIATAVINGLGNEQGKWRQFKVGYWSQVRGAFATDEFRLLDFRGGARERWILTGEGARITLFNLDPSEQDGNLDDYLMRRAIDRGRVAEISTQASIYVKSAQACLLGIGEKLHRIKRGREEGWNATVGSEINGARELMRERGGAVAETLRLITDQASVPGISESRRRILASVRGDLESVTRKFSELNGRIMSSYDEFGSLVVARPVDLPDDLPDFDSDVLPALMAMPSGDAEAVLDALVGLLLPPVVPGILDLGACLSEALEAAWNDEPDASPDTVPEPEAEPPPAAWTGVPSSTLRGGMQAFHDAVSASGHVGVTLSDLARMASATIGTPDEALGASMVLAAVTSGRRDIAVEPLGKEFREPGLVSGDDVIFRWRA
jgi:hypothetical protein